MAAVDDDAVKSGALDKIRRVHKVPGDAGHVLLGHGADVHAVGAHLVIGADGLLAGAKGHLLGTGMGQLAQGDGASAALETLPHSQT